MHKPSQLSFLEQYIFDTLKEKGFDKMTPEDQAKMFPQFVIEAERRLGLALAPHIETDASAADFNALMEGGKATNEEWLVFWKKHVPNFDNLVEKTLHAFAQEMQEALVA